jgi:formamidopyrimidine-DNA glycosylase
VKAREALPMIELPEVMTIAGQMRERLAGRRIDSVSIAEEHPRFMFLNEDLAAYEERLPGRVITHVRASGKWILSDLDSGNILLLGEMFGHILLVPPNEQLPKKAHAVVAFDSGERLTVTIQAWGGVQVLTPEELTVHPYAGAQGLSPMDPSFTFAAFDRALDHSGEWSRKPVKAFLVHEGNVAGIGNGTLQDILFHAGLSPRRKVPDIDPPQRKRLHRAIVETLRQMIDAGGRDTEKDLFGTPGGYRPLMDRRTNGSPCPNCGTPIRKISYLGGTCYVCPSCQV